MIGLSEFIGDSEFDSICSWLTKLSREVFTLLGEYLISLIIKKLPCITTQTRLECIGGRSVESDDCRCAWVFGSLFDDSDRVRDSEKEGFCHHIVFIVYSDELDGVGAIARKLDIDRLWISLDLLGHITESIDSDDLSMMGYDTSSSFGL